MSGDQETTAIVAAINREYREACTEFARAKRGTDRTDGPAYRRALWVMNTWKAALDIAHAVERREQ